MSERRQADVEHALRVFRMWGQEAGVLRDAGVLLSEEVERLSAIVRDLADTSPFYDHNGCAYCGHRVGTDGSDPHEGDCLYRRAVECVR